MNVVYLHTHDSGRYLDPGVSPVPLPGVEDLAREAVTFRNAFSAAPTCSPSRSALLTGTYPHENGMVGLAHRGFRLNTCSGHLAQVLTRAGVETALCGVQHVASDAREIGYDRILDEPQRCSHPVSSSPWDRDRENTQLVIDFLHETHSRPFFLSFGLFSTHRPFPDPPGAVPARSYHQPPAEVPDAPETRRDMEGFLTSLQIADEAVGRVCAALRVNGLWQETVVLLTTDHGPPFPGMKCTLRDAGTGVFLCMRIPGLASDGRVEQALVSQIDIYPTICEALDVPVPHGVRGRSLLPLLRGETPAVRDAVFSEINYNAAYEPARAVRTGRYKLIRYCGDAASPLPVNVDDSSAKTLMGSAGYFAVRRPEEAVFDLLLDPLEQQNVIAAPDYQGIRYDLSAMLESWMADTADPILEGQVPRPPGSRVNRPDARSPTENTYE